MQGLLFYSSAGCLIRFCRTQTVDESLVPEVFDDAVSFWSLESSCNDVLSERAAMHTGEQHRLCYADAVACRVGACRAVRGFRSRVSGY